MNHSIAENFMRSAKAPQISAGVMMAKVIWKHMNTDSGIVPFSAPTPIPIRKKRELPPIQGLPSVKAQL
jgi:hypothetical protein